MRRTISVALPLAAMTLWAGGCWNSAANTYSTVASESSPEGLRAGVATTVAIRPDVLGLSGGGMAEAGAESVGPIGLTVSGSLVSADAGWLVLDGEDGQRRWVRLATVTWIRQDTPPPDAAAPGATGAGEPAGNG